MDALTQRKNISIQTILVTVGSILMVSKFAAYFITHSNAILTDAMESIVNVVAGGFTLYGLYLTAKPRDENHPYGHGKIEFISSGIEGGLIAGAGLMILFKSIYNLIEPHEIHELDVGLYIVGIAGIINFGMGALTARRGKKIGSLPLEATGKHLMSDGWSTLGLIIGIGLIIITGWMWLDSAVAILFGLLILYTGVRILRPSIAGIMDEADYRVIEQIAQILEANRRPAWIDVHNMRVIKYGPTLHIDCHVTIPWYYSTREAHNEIEALDQLINKSVTADVEFFIHVDPCLPDSCPLCTIADCKVRQHPFQKTIPWTLKNVLQNQKHQLK